MAPSRGSWSTARKLESCSRPCGSGSAFERLSEVWRERLLDALVDGFLIPNHPLKSRRGVVPLQTLNYGELKEIYARTFVPDVARVDVELLLAAGRLWGADALGRFRFDRLSSWGRVFAAGGAPAKLSVVGSLCSTVCSGNVPASRIFQHFSGFCHDTEGDGPLPSDMAKCLNRWAVYQRERFPLASHVPLVAAFSASAVCFSSLLRGHYAAPTAAALGVAFLTSLLFFLQLRIADEFKDFEEDSRFRPYRPVPRGLVTLRELAWLARQQPASSWRSPCGSNPRSCGCSSRTWLYLTLMTREFFVREMVESAPSRLHDVAHADSPAGGSVCHRL